jgi:hypothetical protein
VYNPFAPELRQHLQPMLGDLFGITVNAGADDPEPVRRQNSAVQLVGQVLLILLIFLDRYLLHGNLRLSWKTGICHSNANRFPREIANPSD